ncbi:MAG: RNA polymerase sigma factor [Planctomycetota bacterium]|nr:RNA polymerase sigma factor [Planctomycetota bacterium]
MIGRQDEHNLIRRAQAGDGAAISSLIRAHQGGLYAYLLKLSGHAETAEDIVQEAFVRVLKNLERFDTRFRFSTWLYTIAKRLYVNAAQRMKPAYDTDMLSDQRCHSPNPGQLTAERESRECARDVIDFALEGLPEHQRQIVELYHERGWPVPRIARYLEMPQGTVKSHLFRARKRMKCLIQADDHWSRCVDDSLS